VVEEPAAIAPAAADGVVVAIVPASAGVDSAVRGTAAFLAPGLRGAHLAVGISEPAGHAAGLFGFVAALHGASAHARTRCATGSAGSSNLPGAI
jgi:hypothetical protein